MSLGVSSGFVITNNHSRRQIKGPNGGLIISHRQPTALKDPATREPLKTYPSSGKGMRLSALGEGSDLFNMVTTVAEWAVLRFDEKPVVDFEQQDADLTGKFTKVSGRVFIKGSYQDPAFKFDMTIISASRFDQAYSYLVHKASESQYGVEMLAEADKFSEQTVNRSLFLFKKEAE